MKINTEQGHGQFSQIDFIRASAVVLFVAAGCVAASRSNAGEDAVGGGQDLGGRRVIGPASNVVTSTGLIKEAAAALKIAPRYMPLPPGAVRPTGWLLDWARAARDGLTGHLDERAAAFGKGWSGEHFETRGVREQGTGEPLEQCAYWFDGLVRLAYALHDDQLIERVRSRLDAVVQGVLEGGPSLIYWRPKNQVERAFENWAHSHMARALVAYYSASGDRKILEALRRTYRDFPLPEMQSGFPIRGLNGPVNVDPMLEVYAMSGDRHILDAALAMTGRDAFRETVDRWLQGDLQPGHAVIFYEYIRVPALFYPWTGDERHLQATLGALDWHDRHHLLPVGVCSGEEYHAGIGSTRNVETCNVSVSIWTYVWLLRITGEQRFADRIEQVFFNAGPAPIGRDFQTMCYYQSPNRLSTSLPRDEPRDPSLPGAYRFTETGHSTLCCTGNASRILPFYLTHMWMAANDGGLAATLYGPCRVEITAADGVPVSIESKTSYPFEEQVVLTINPEQPVSFPLHLRIPGWCQEPELEINGTSIELQPNAQGFAIVERAWKPGDTILLRFPMTARVVQGRETPFPRIKRYTETEPGERNRELAGLTKINNPFTSVYCGPLLFALGIPDENANQERPGADYQYALDVTAGEAESRIEIVRHQFPDHWRWQFNAPVQLRVPAVRFEWRPTELQPLPAFPVESDQRTTVTLVPYGCTKFRVSMFPVSKRSWQFERSD